MNANVLPFSTSTADSPDVRRPPTMGEIKQSIKARRRMIAALKRRVALLNTLRAVDTQLQQVQDDVAQAEGVSPLCNVY